MHSAITASLQGLLSTCAFQSRDVRHIDMPLAEKFCFPVDHGFLQLLPSKKKLAREQKGVPCSLLESRTGLERSRVLVLLLHAMLFVLHPKFATETPANALTSLSCP